MPKNRIYIVDDQQTARTIIKGIAEQAGYKVVGEAKSVDQALEAISQVKIDFLICDIHLGDKSGVSVLKHVREGLPNVSTIMITGEATKAVLLEVVNGGAHAFITKPINAKKIIGALERCVEMQGKTLKDQGVNIGK